MTAPKNVVLNLLKCEPYHNTTRPSVEGQWLGAGKAVAAPKELLLRVLPMLIFSG